MAFDLEDIIVALTMGLGKEYDQFVASIDAMATQEVTVDYVITRMLNEEVRSGEKGSTHVNDAHVVKTNQRAGSDRRTGVRKCWRCGETDHIRSECNIPSDVKCGNCGRRGHTTEACLKPGGAESPSETASTSLFAF